jgi:SAM-dependent methyltransferase
LDNQEIDMSGLTLKPLENCRVCGTKLRLIEKMDKVPLDGAKFEKNVCMPDFYDSALYLCPHCGLYQMPDIENFSDFYNFSNTKYIESLANSRKKTFEELLLFSGGRENALGIEDVGFDRIASGYFQKVLTIDPERLCREGAGENNHFVPGECLSLGSRPEPGFDMAYIICPLSHVDNPLRIMRDIGSVLKEGGVGWIEVLNGETLVAEGQYYNFMPILLNHWTPYSLATLLKLSGLDTLMIRPGLGGDHLNVFFQKPVKKPSLMARRDRQAAAILDEAGKHKNVVVWGAGAKAHYLFGYLSDKLHVSHIVDGSPAKQGLFMPGAGVPVEKPSGGIFKATDLVIIFAASYEKEITETLRGQYNYRGKIFCLSGN